MYKVGLTGGIGSGKSTVAKLLAMRGVAVYVADERAKSLMEESEAVRSAIIAIFGEEAYASGALNRAWLAEQVFASKELLARLNAVVHPAVMDDFDRWAEAQTSEYVVIESAILFEAGLDGRVDATIAVMSPEALRLQRAMKRDGASREAIEARMRNQMSDDERCARARYAIVNIELEELEEDVEQLHRRLCYDARA